MPPKKSRAKSRKSTKDAHKQKKSNPLIVEYENEPPSMAAERMLSTGDIIWARHYLGVKIQQLFSDFYNPVIDLLQQSTSKDDPLCRIFEMNKNWKAVEEMLYKARDWLSQCLSLVAVDEETGNVYGALIGRIVNNEEMLNEIEELKRMELEKEIIEMELENTKKKELPSTSKKSVTDRKKKSKTATKKGKTKGKGKGKDKDRNQPSAVFRKSEMKGSAIFKKSTVQKSHFRYEPPVDIIPVEEKVPVIPCVFDDDYRGYSDEYLTKFLQFRYCLFNVIDLFLEARCYYKIYVWAVDKEHQNQGIGKALLDAAETMCHGLQIPLIVSIFTSFSSQYVAEKYDYLQVAMLTYEAWSKIRIENELYACLMIKYLEVPQIDSYISKPEHKEIPGEGEEPSEDTVSRTMEKFSVRDASTTLSIAGKGEKKKKKKKKKNL